MPPDATSRSRFAPQAESGVVAAWFALMLTVLLAMAGFATDMAYWYLVASRAQNAADAAALGGVAFLPGESAEAMSTATKVARTNGFGTSTPEVLAANRLRVTVTARVDTFFARLVGVSTVTIRRSSTAEYEQPVAMGSPDATLGNDPDSGYLPQFWINITGSGAYKANGDRFNSKTCGPSGNTSDYACSTATTPNNAEYSTDGIFFGIEAPGSGPMRVQLFDPLYAGVGNLCSSFLPTSSQVNALIALPGTTNLPTNYYADAATRYVAGAGPYCTGDQDLGPTNLPRPVTTAILRLPDQTPWDDTDNPVVCSARYRAYNLGSGGSSSPTIYNLLSPVDGVLDSEAVVNPNDGAVTFAEAFRRWVTLCDLAQPVAGTYILQLRTNASSTDATAYDPNNDAQGTNRLALRAGIANGAYGINGTNFNVYARGRLIIYANAGSTAFRAARIMPGGTGRVLEFTMFDMGDASSTGTLRFRPPSDSNYSNFTGCTFSRNDGATLSFDPLTCRLSNVSSSTGFNGRLVTVQIPIPDNYTCDQNQFAGCWVTVEPQYGNGTTVNDTTTWTAAMLGSPVRLVQ